MNKTLSKLNFLKKELDELKKEQSVSTNKVQKKSDDVSDIINKYKSNQATKEFDIFAETFKNFNQTAAAMSKIDMNDINMKIKSALSDVKNKFGIIDNVNFLKQRRLKNLLIILIILLIILILLQIQLMKINN